MVATILKKSFRVVVTHRKSKVTLFAGSKIVWKEKKIYICKSVHIKNTKGKKKGQPLRKSSTGFGEPKGGGLRILSKRERGKG